MINITRNDAITDMIPKIKKPVPVKVKLMNEEFALDTAFGMMYGKAGDYIVEYINGTRNVISPTTYDRKFTDNHLEI